jgi:hypothetical protein
MNHYNSNAYRNGYTELNLINILNNMYNDNSRHIISLTNAVNNLIESNVQIRNAIFQITSIHNTTHNTGHNFSRRNNSRRWDNSSSNSSSNNNRIMLGNQSYIIDTIAEYNIPRNSANRDVFSNILEQFLQPIEIYPTQTQIESATRRVRYCDISRPINTSCPISMEEFNDTDMVTVIRHCGHIFHTENLMSWFRSNCRCPVCRYDIRDYNSNVSSQFFDNQNNVDGSNNDTSNFNEERNNLNHFESNNRNIDINNLYDLSGNLVDTQNMYINIINSLLNNRRNI